MNGRIWKIRYEGLWMVCFKCGCLGHKDERYPLFQSLNTSVAEGEGDQQLKVQEKSSARPEISDNYGAWMLVGSKAN